MRKLTSKILGALQLEAGDEGVAVLMGMKKEQVSKQTKAST